MKPLTANSGNYKSIDYKQIDTIRIITICFIIWGHSLFGWEQQLKSTAFNSYFTSLVYQLGKISTIAFFLIAGFLIRPKLHQYTVAGYLKERFPRVYLPWAIFTFIFLTVCVLQELPVIEIWEQKDPGQFFSGVYKIFVGTLFYTSYWFVITYAISMAILVFFKNHVEKMWFGVILGGFAIFYSINLYFQWVAPNHSKAILGYAFFVWIGIKINKNFGVIMGFLNRMRWWSMGLLLLLLLVLSCVEARLLQAMGCLDPYASNRITNSLFSIAFFLALLKVGPSTSLNKLQPRKLVYGIFLVHNIVIVELTFWLKKTSFQFLSANIWGLLLTQLLFFSVILATTYLIVYRISNSRLQWTIGLKA